MGANYTPSPEWRMQPDEMYAVALAQNIWGIALAFTGLYTRIIECIISVQGFNETIELEITCDGSLWLGARDAVDGTIYNTWFNFASNVGQTLIITVNASQRFEMIGHNIQIRIRKITAAGASTMEVRTIYAVN